MGEGTQVTRSRKDECILSPISHTALDKTLRAQEWRKDLLVSWLFRTCIRLQTSLDRRFLKYGITFQEASVLFRCVQGQRITPGKLATALGRDKGKITRFIDRLEASRLVARDIHRSDRRFSVIKPTGKGKQVARALDCVFENIRRELFVGILESEVRRLGQMLPQLHKNATGIGSRKKGDAVRQRRRIGSHGMKTEGPRTRQLQLAEHMLTPSPNGHAVKTMPREEHEELVLK
jgi:DNA-binding MarR family transcriptional regulator